MNTHKTWFVSSQGEIQKSQNPDSVKHQRRVQFGNAFATKEEAMIAKKAFKLAFTAKSDENSEGWLCVEHGQGGKTGSCSRCNTCQSCATKFIDLGLRGCTGRICTDSCVCKIKKISRDELGYAKQLKMIDKINKIVEFLNK